MVAKIAHSIRDVLADIINEKIEEYMTGEDLTGEEVKELSKAIKPKENDRDKDSLSLEEAEEKARIKDGSMFAVAMFKSAKGNREIWSVIRKHLEEGENDNSDNDKKCSHSLKEILYDIPVIQEQEKQFTSEE